jgi:signal transduction histidine kinase
MRAELAERPSPARATDSDAHAGEPQAALALLAHELRNCIAPLANALEVIGCGTAEHRVAERMVALAQRQVRQMARLVDDALDAARLASGNVELQLVEVPLQQLVEDAVRACSHAAMIRGHTLTVIAPQKPLPVRCDPMRMQQVLGNVIGNAVRYTPPGGRIGVRVRREGPRATVSVSDNGIGIETGQLQRLFGMFQRAPRARAVCGDGLGLGLAVSRRLAEMHGGSLEAFSDGKDKGSTFRISLPAQGDAGMTRKQSGPDTSKYEAWMRAERKAAEADRKLRQSGKTAPGSKHASADPQMAAQAVELRNAATSLFEEAICEMHLAVEAALQKTRSRLH